MNHLVLDPIFGKCARASTCHLPTNEVIESTISNGVARAGGRARRIFLQDEVNIDDNHQVKARRDLARAERPNEDPDTQFPIVDLTEPIRTANANRNILRLFYGVRELWRDVVRAEKEDGKPWDYVVFLRDDTLWLQDFDLNRLLAQRTATELFLLSCDAREPPMRPEEVNDHIVIASRPTAEIFGHYFEHLLDTDPHACKANLAPDLQQLKVKGCNSEMLLSWILKQNNVSITFVGQGLVPFQRAVHVATNFGVRKCFHKCVMDSIRSLASLKICRPQSLKPNPFLSLLRPPTP